MVDTLNKEMFQTVLNHHDDLSEAVLIVRKDNNNCDVVVVYAIPVLFTLPELTRLTKCLLPSTLQQKDKSFSCVKVVLVNAIPRNKNGSIDEASLVALPVLDSGFVNCWQDEILAADGVEKAAVINVLTHLKNDSLHCSDVVQKTDGSLQSDVYSSTDSNTFQQNTRVAITKNSTLPAELHADGLLLSDQLDDAYDLSLANTLYRAAKISPEKGVCYIDETGNRFFQTYPELLNTAQIVLAGLYANGLQRGDKVLLQCADNRDYLSVFWACVLGGLIPVPLSIAPVYTAGNAVVQKLVNTCKLLEEPFIVCSDSLVDDFKRLFQEAKFIELLSQKSPLDSNRLLFMQQLMQNLPEAPDSTQQQSAPDDLALLLLTSGSTGIPKAVMHTHKTLINRSAATSSLNRFDRDDVSLNWMPLDHVGGIVMFHLRDVFNACSQIQVATSWILENPLRWINTIDDERASVTWAPNFAFALVAEQATEISQQNWDLSCMRFVLNGGEAVVAQTATRFLQLLESHGLAADAMKPAWGMSETASGVCYSHSFTAKTVSDANAGVSVGVPVGVPIPNTSVRIVDENNKVLNEGQKGSLHIKGASVTPGYYKKPELNQQAFTDDGWFDTGDAGVIVDGNLTITARIKDEIIINGINYPAAEIEAIVESVTGVEISYTAACAVRSVVSDTDSLALFFCPENEQVNHEDESFSTLLKSIQSTVSSSAGIKPDYIIALEKSQIPKTNIGKIQRSSIKQNFEAGEYAKSLRESEIALGNNVIPAWFYKKSWYQKKLNESFEGFDSNKKYLIFCDDYGFGSTLCNRLQAAGVQTAAVYMADGYSCHENNRYAISPDEASHFPKLFQALQAADFYPDSIIHCWTYSVTDNFEQLQTLQLAQQTGSYSLLQILQALATVNVSHKQTDLYVVSSNVQQYQSVDAVLNPHATILGLLKTAPYEYDWLSAQHIDLDFHQNEAELASMLDTVSLEIVSQNGDDEILYRQGNRYSWHLSAENFAAESLSSYPLKPGGIVLITGGLGGIGAYLARFLMTKFNARLILIGRSELPPREKWSQLSQQENKLASRIKRYLEIEALGAEFIYHSADVSDTDLMQSLIVAAESKWQDELNAVFHLAVGGDVGDRWQDESAHTIESETISSYEQMFSTKVYASYGLARLVSERKNTFMVSFGSVIGVFGAARYAAYASAHTYLSQLTQYFSQKHPGRFYQFNWAVWENIGLSQQEPAYAMDYYQSIGYALIPAAVGMDCLLAGLSHQHAELVIGLDADKWPIRKHLSFDGGQLLKPVACFTAEQSVNLASLTDKVDVCDSFGVRSQFECFQLEQMPVDSDGFADTKVLQSSIENLTQSNENKPETEMEKQIAVYWCEVLDVAGPGRDSSFFQLGGNSLTATKLISKIKQAFDIPLDMRDLFNAATIAEMSDLVSNRQQKLKPQSSDKYKVPEPKMPEHKVIDLNTAQELLANLDQLTEAEVAELLKVMQQEQQVK